MKGPHCCPCPRDAHAQPWAAPVASPGQRGGCGGVSCTDGQILRIEQRDFSRAYLLQPGSHLEQLFALYEERLSSSFVCFLNFCANVFIPAAQLSYSPALFLFFSPTTYKFLKIRSFNGSADSAWTLLYQHGVHWKDRNKRTLKTPALCVWWFSLGNNLASYLTIPIQRSFRFACVPCMPMNSGINNPCSKEVYYLCIVTSIYIENWP